MNPVVPAGTTAAQLGATLRSTKHGAAKLVESLEALGYVTPKPPRRSHAEF